MYIQKVWIVTLFHPMSVYTLFWDMKSELYRCVKDLCFCVYQQLVRIEGQWAIQYRICTIYVRSSVFPLAFHLCCLTASLLATVYNIYIYIYTHTSVCVSEILFQSFLFSLYSRLFIHCLLSSLHRNLIFCFYNVFVYILFLFLSVYLRTFTLWSRNSVTA
jgi:hypothetical protein